MKTKDFSFDLPEHLIAQYPRPERGASRLLCLPRNQGPVSHRLVRDLPALVPPGTVMVFNDSRVRKARLVGVAEDTGGRVELLLLERVGEGTWRVMMRRAKRQHRGRRYRLPAGVVATVVDEDGAYRTVHFSPEVDDHYLNRHGHVPLPPYIRREDAAIDEDRYQTVYAAEVGSVAAPTAGLHFTDELLSALRARGVIIAWVTLHVGLGTFLPVRAEHLEDHEMHEERFTVPPDTADAVEAAKSTGRGVLAVGTTSLRALESAWSGNRLARGEHHTRLFIYPGYRFQVVDELFTNLHTPESSLLMLAAAFAGKERIEAAYREAIAQEYLFFSYGDAMYIHR
jgi:S-adenosylmethionine:tRNA ribosyltransferase-isomerase